MRGNMKAERARSGMTAEEVAKKIGVHPNAVLRWEAGEAEPMASNLVKLSTLYGCSAEYLLGYTDVRNGKAVAISR